MVLYDDKKWLCRLIRTAFTIEDDSGVCEKVLKEKPYLGDQQGGGGDTSSASSEDSFDIRDGADLGHRRRSNTAIRLEKLDKQKKAQNATQFVRITDNDVIKNDLIFEPNMDYQEDSKTRGDHVVHVQQLLTKGPHPDSIPYMRYATFESSCHPSIPYRKFAIFVTFLPIRIRSYPVKVAVVATAKVLELIGLVLWVISKTYPDVKLKTVHQYNIQISDVDGEWDNDFPPLDHHEPIGKFSFSHLALVPADGQAEQPKLTYIFTFLLPNAGELRVSLPDPQTITMKEALEIVFQKSGWIKLTGNTSDINGYHLEKLGHPSVVFKDLNMNIGETKCREFCLVRNGAKSVQAARVSDATSKPENDMPGHSELFRVTVTGRFNRVRNALCVIHRDRMELEFQAKIKTYPFSHISGVKLDATKNRVLVSLTQGAQSNYTSSSHLQLSTADVTTATELHHRLQCIIESYPKGHKIS
ncbi:target of rapamycin complex 2 subunit MAPKAP1 isoform X2 [Folsomia candida]|uniref:Target of rapamycin complex 2 subunit MAPKAP1 n=1 Tax=Folsomia candida TaxID=158441 RepID=A0A226ENR3_FOLCA|nr:target of rapamycin complex 2 subunit MAPKAP1 isoform X2 [Folsomia candida]OXA58654.1 Target of rapamycin complex 2 subunit MAPKAP1 [Folsomia candida]